MSIVLTTHCGSTHRRFILRWKSPYKVAKCQCDTLAKDVCLGLFVIPLPLSHVLLLPLPLGIIPVVKSVTAEESDTHGLIPARMYTYVGHSIWPQNTFSFLQHSMVARSSFFPPFSGNSSVSSSNFHGAKVQVWVISIVVIVVILAVLTYFVPLVHRRFTLKHHMPSFITQRLG